MIVIKIIKKLWNIIIRCNMIYKGLTHINIFIDCVIENIITIIFIFWLWNLSIANNKHVITIYVVRNGKLDTHHTKLATQALYILH